MKSKPTRYRLLDAKEIISTVLALQARVNERFPGSGLGRTVAELRNIAEETVTRITWIQKPNILLRCGAGLLTLAIMGLLIKIGLSIDQFNYHEYTNFIQALDSSISSIVFIGATVLFLVSWEARIKRNRALEAIHELRAVSHIIDMHQLTKDPESYFSRGPATQSSPRRLLTPFELNRYLNYCSEALALASKIAALYVQSLRDPVLLDAVDDIEDLTAGFSRKIWQKITINESLYHPSAGTAPAATEPPSAKN
jgi:hypothetical protein